MWKFAKPFLCTDLSAKLRELRDECLAEKIVSVQPFLRETSDADRQ